MSMHRLAAPAAVLASALLSASFATAQEIGIPVCDDFILRYETCIETRIPDNARAQFTETLTQWRLQLKSLAGDIDNELTLTGQCNQMIEEARASLAGFGCTF
jgi:hypothetical protein